jgi:hypothetical protein
VSRVQRVCGPLAVALILWGIGEAGAQVPGGGVQVTPSPRQVSVMAGQASPPVSLTVTTAEPVRTPESWIFSVELPAALSGHVDVQPPRVTVSVAPGQRQATATFRFLTRPTAPAGSHAVRLTAGPDGPSTQVGLMVEAPPPERDPEPVGLQLSFAPPALQLCQGVGEASGTLRIQAEGAYRGTPLLTWGVPTGLSLSPPAPAPAPLPPDREIPFRISAPDAPAGSQVLTVVAMDPASGARAEARAQVTVEPVSFTPRMSPGSLTLEAGGPGASLGITAEAGRCFGEQPIQVNLTSLPSGVTSAPGTGVVPSPGVPASFQLQALPSAAPGQHMVEVELVQAGRFGEVRRQARLPLVVAAAALPERPPAPRIDRVTPATVEPGQEVTLELVGQHLEAGMSLAFQPVGIELLGPLTVQSPTRATVQVRVADDALPGVRVAAATSPAGHSTGPGQLAVQVAQQPQPAEPEPEPEPDPEPDPEQPPPSVQRLDFAGFTVLVTQVGSPELDGFSGQGVLEDFVFAGRLQTVTVGVEFDGLTLEPTATLGRFQVLSGEALFDSAVNLSLPLEVAGLGVQLQRMLLTPEGATIDGRIFLPFTEHATPSTDIVMGGGGGQGEGSPLDGFTLVPALDLGDVMPFQGGGATLAFEGTPVNDGPWLNAMILEAGLGPADAPPWGLDIAVLPGAPVGSMTFSDQPLSPDGDFLYTGIASIDQYAIGQSGISFRAQQGLEVVVDLSRSQNGDQAALNSAYLAWDTSEPPLQVQGMGVGLNFGDVTTPPGVPHTSPQWMGLIFLNARLTAPGIGMEDTASHVAWVAAGFQTLLAQSFGGVTETTTVQGWEVNLLNAALGLRNSVLVDAGALGDVHLPLFNQAIRVVLKQTNGGTPSMSAVGPVARHYGHTVVIGEGGAFFWHGGALKLGFTDARWAFNGDLDAPQPQAPPQGGLHPWQQVDAFAVEGYQTSLEFLKNSYQRSFHIRYLTLTADGGADLFGTTQRSLASVPELNFLNYPFLSGGAWILLEQQGTSYTLGLRGNLELAGNLGGVQATTRYTVQNGQETTWTFEGALQAGVNVVDLDLQVAGEVDLTTRDVFFYGTGGFTVQELFQVEATGAFGRQGTTRYWFVQASLDLQGTPLIDTGILAFYSFKGGMAHNLQAGAAGTCGILDPVAFAQNANQCVDASVNWTFLAGTVLAPSEGYGGDSTVHVDGTFMISSQGSIDILGQAWMMRSFSQGYGAGAPPQAAAHIGINKDRFVMTACVGPSGSSQGAPESAQTISCEGLQPLRYPAQVPVVEIRGWTGFLLDWSTNTYYLAVGHYGNKVEASFFGLAYRKGYLVLAYSPSVPASWLPPLAGGQVGFYAGREAGYEWNFEYSWGVICDNKVWAYAALGSESNFFLEVQPFALYADVYYWVSMGVGAQICGIGGGVKVAGDLGGSVYVSQALGELSGTFSGEVLVCGPNRCLRVIGISNVNVNITLWQA